MNYQKIYQNLIEKRQYNPVEGYSESHHIIPRCIGGSDNYENLIYLSAREHFIAHVLLVKIYKNKKLLYAANMMSNFKKYNSKQYSWLKELHFNTPVSEETKKKISEGNKGKKVSEETKIKISIKAKERLSKSENNPMYGKKHSEETKEKFRLREQRKREKKLLLDSNDE